MNTNNAALQGLRALLSLLSQPAVSDEVDRLFGDRNPLTTTGTSVTTSTTTATVPTVTASATADSSSVTVAPASAAVVPVSTASVTIQTPNVRNIGPLFNPASILTADRGRGRGRGRGRSRGRGREHTAPYTSPGPVFTRIVVLLSGPGVEDVPRGRERQQIRDGNFEARVSFRNRMTPQEVRTSILHAFQAQGHLRTVTDCSQFDFLNCDEVNKRKLVQLDPPSQNPTATTLKSLWRSQCPIYIRPHFSLRNTTQAMPSSTSLRASPGFLFRQNIQSLLGQSLSNQNQATNIVSAIHRDTPTRNASAAYTTTTITNTSNTLTRNAGTHVHMENTGHIPAAGTNTSHSMNSGNSHTTSTTPTPNTNTIVTSTTITVNARHTHTTNIGNTVPPHALLTTTAPAESSNHSTQTQVEGTAIAATVDANNDRDILFPSWDLNIDTLGGLNDSPNRRADLISLSSPTGSSHSMESIHSYSSIHSSRGSANQDLNEEDSMDGSRVAVQVLEDVVALPSSVVVEDSEVGSINEHLNQHSSQILSAFTDVAPEMFCAWQNEVYGWQHPNIITMPLELLCHQAAADMTTVLLYFSDNNACDIFRDDFCRNILSNPDFIEACNNVYFWATECCSESAEIQGTLQLPTTTPMLAAICHNASGTAMPPFLLTNLCDIQVVITFILAAVERQQVQSTIRSNREIRQRQDEAYQESLAIDRERDHRRLVEEETMERRRVAAEANQHEIREALNQLQEEPLENVDTVRVRIRGPQGRTVQRTFFTTDTTEVLFLAAFALLALPSQHFRLRGSVATSETTSCIVIENNGLSLSELLQGDTTLSVEMTDEE